MPVRASATSPVTRTGTAVAVDPHEIVAAVTGQRGGRGRERPRRGWHLGDRHRQRVGPDRLAAARGRPGGTVDDQRSEVAVTGSKSKRHRSRIRSATRRRSWGARSVRHVVPSASSVTLVGTECWPSATTARSRWSTVTGAARSTLDPLPCWCPMGAVHAVAGSPSNARDARASSVAAGGPTR